ncbi:MAG: type II secretion system inner membrane protein GspF [Gammaproteobacteria bacterium]|nr:type II secretion system inner membrane protein GspF [Gammaproteobacteria bacterium]
MGAFEYVALNARGGKRKGVVEGDTPRQARQLLRDQGLTPLSVASVVKTNAQRPRKFSPSGGMGAAELALITRQLATLTQSGLPLEETLRTVSQQSENSRTKSILMAVRSRVVEGHPLVTGLADFPRVFSELYRATVAAGEQSGHLDVVLERLADYTEQRMQMRQKIQLALLYPVFLTVMAMLITIGLLTYVVPQVIQVFENTGQQLPWITHTLITVSDFLQVHGLEILLVMLVGFILARYITRVPHLRLALHELLLRIPLVKRLVRGLNTARFARTLSILAASGVPVLEAMHISAQVLTNLPMRNAVVTATLRVREGASLHGAMEKEGHFPPMMLQLIASGEASGKLETMLARAASHQEREVETLVASFLGLFEPLLILLMGGLVLTIVLAIMMPIFDLNQLVT